MKHTGRDHWIGPMVPSLLRWICEAEGYVIYLKIFDVFDIFSLDICLPLKNMCIKRIMVFFLFCLLYFNNISKVGSTYCSWLTCDLRVLRPLNHLNFVFMNIKQLLCPQLLNIHWLPAKHYLIDLRYGACILLKDYHIFFCFTFFPLCICQL